MKTHLQQLIQQAIEKLQQDGKFDQNLSYAVKVEHTRDKKHGDFACNIALILTKQVKIKPQELAQLLIDNLVESPNIEKTEIAGPGFINFFVKESMQQNIIKQILNEKTKFGLSNIGNGKRVHIEYVSANPTGPLHVGHGRGAAYGSTVANLLKATGYDVHREYYVNDAGRQMDILAVSVW